MTRRDAWERFQCISNGFRIFSQRPSRMPNTKYLNLQPLKVSNTPNTVSSFCRLTACLRSTRMAWMPCRHRPQNTLPSTKFNNGCHLTCRFFPLLLSTVKVEEKFTSRFYLSVVPRSIKVGYAAHLAPECQRLLPEHDWLASHSRHFFHIP